MATRNELSVDDETETPPADETTTEDTPKPEKTKKLKKGWKDPKDLAAKGKYKRPSGNIVEDM